MTGPPRTVLARQDAAVVVNDLFTDRAERVAAKTVAEAELGGNPDHDGHQIATAITSSGRPIAITNPATTGTLTATPSRMPSERN